jgi:hypothetical protein
VLEIPEQYFDVLERMAELTIDCTRPDGQITQIGDNDSGRFLKLFITIPFDPLDHRHFVAAVNGLVGRGDFRDYAGPFAVESSIVSAFAAREPAMSGSKPHAAERVTIGDMANWPPGARRLERRFPSRVGGLRQGLGLRGYPEFGLWIFRSPRLHLTVRCGRIGREGTGGHCHNDQLAIELVLDGEDLVRDPGSYLYTPLPERRNEYRSVNAHFAPHPPNAEPGRLDLGLFQLSNEASGRVLYFGPRGFVGQHSGYGTEVFRKVEIFDDAVVVTDWSELDLVADFSPPAFSPGYGMRRG